jgi:hypothetical protein
MRQNETEIPTPQNWLFGLSTLSFSEPLALDNNTALPQGAGIGRPRCYTRIDSKPQRGE